ncbi:Bug family tripartite tricarboxylate transporter substrate binding protein [Alkalihalobacillus deserti]|uniref:Bug family tripartite tricarboxylate transporter substrate binding protein n=1 Tax=Alkalihalobacillus deserti TaxID=2879466 RepID=UPI001D15AA47|nr:tripartite tricarboxylate transporter substrate binding protein [Alkalihalobacillus deserti]
MKKITMVFLIILSVLVVGCQQTTEQSQSNPEAQVGSNFPSESIELIVPTPPGGSADIIARILAKIVPKYLPNEKSIVVVNQSGGNNTLGVSDVYKAQPDGYTLGFVPSTPLTVEPHFGNTPYKHDSFQTIMRVSKQDGFLFVRSDSPWETYDEWFEYVEENPRKFRVGVVAGVRNLIERVNIDAGIELVIVPYDGFAEAMTALLGGHLEGVFSLPAIVKGQLEAGDIRPIFSSSGQQDVLEGVVTLQDKGFDIVEDRINGVIAPKGIPKEVLTTLHSAFKQALEDPEVIEELKKVDVEPYYGSPEEYQQSITESAKVDGETLQIIGLIE